MNRRILRLFVFIIFAAIFVLQQAPAQQATGKIVGTVKDPVGAVVPGAEVIVTNVDTQVKNTAKTDVDGSYYVSNLPIGEYKLTVHQTGFQTTVTKPYQLEINQSLRIDVDLRVGASTETVEVTGNATMVEAYNSTIGASITERPIVNMPLNGRNVLDLAKLEPGVVELNVKPDSSLAGSFTIAGGRSDAVTFLLDGGLNNSLLTNEVVFNPNPDAIAEFRVLESNYSAEYGRNGGGIISVVTKSGTNGWHGSAFEFNRNDAFNANSFFNKLFGLPRDVLKRNQFGGTFGGPIKKDKAFFFVSYQKQIQHQAQVQTATVPTALEIGGDFSQSGPESQAAVASFLQANSYFQADPTLAAQGIIDPTKINPIIQKYIAAGLIPNSGSNTSSTLSTNALATDNFDELTTKLDFNFTQNDRLAATLGWGRAPVVRPFAGGASIPFPVADKTHKYFLNLAYTKNLSPTLLNEARMTIQRLNQAEGNPIPKLPTAADLGIAITPDLSTGPPILYFYDSGMTIGFTYRGPLDKVNNTFEYSDVLSWTKGKHTLKAGGLFSPYQNNTIYAYEVNGEFDFYGSGGSVGTGVEFADMLLGVPDEYYQFGNAPSNIRSKSWGVFAQDEWRITPRLVLNFGLRYEYNSPKKDTQGRSFSIVPGLQSTRFVNAPLGLVFPGDKGAPDGANFPDRNDFAPRFGFSWSPLASNKLSVRGGFGIFYNILGGEDNLQFNGQAPFFGFADFYFDSPSYPGAIPYFADPFGSTGNINNFPSQPPAPNIDFAANGFIPFSGNGVYFVNPHLRTPYIMQYNLSVQQQLGNAYLLNVAYVGTQSRKLTGLVDSNPFILGTLNRVLNVQPGGAPEIFSYTDTFDNVGNQSYNAFQSSLKKQITGSEKWFGATYFTFGYTWAKNIDTASGFRQNSDRVPYYDRGRDRAVSDMDVAHRITFSGGWDLPFQNAWASGPQRLTKGWSIYPIITWRTGFPIDIRGFLSRGMYRPGPSGAGDSSLVRPNLTGSKITTVDPWSNMTPDGALWVPISNFDVSAMSYGFCPPGTPDADCEDVFNTSDTLPYSPSYGTMARNSFRGPGRTNMDFAIAKSTKLWNENSALELRLEFFNVFNHTQFDNPDSGHLSPYNSNFGLITTTADPRIIQLGARITF
ncbi:MAG: TonB-dependent receptor [Terriglobia bacterium]|nr:TonB-dependent receptor [Terriglobia bacterium]